MKAEIPVGWHTGKHLHGEEAIYVESGEGFLILDDKRYDFRHATIFHIPYRSPHQLFNTGKEPVSYLSGLAWPLEASVYMGRMEQIEDAGENNAAALAAPPPEESQYWPTDERRIAMHEEQFELSSETDETVREISEFLRKAQANAEDNFGKTVKEKLYLLGYVTGVVEHWAELRKALADQFFDYLRAVLRETNVLATDEISEMVAKFEELSTDPCFGIARTHGRNDPARGEDQGEESAPTGLRKFAVACSA